MLRIDDYIRTVDGRIGKYLIHNNADYIVTNDKRIEIDSKDIKKYSDKIINVIEMNDIVNAKKVIAIIDNTQLVLENNENVYEENIKTVLTKENKYYDKEC